MKEDAHEKLRDYRRVQSFSQWTSLSCGNGTKNNRSRGRHCCNEREFLQRGEPAIIDKWHRANEALQNGVDLVVELPVEWAVQSADYFAKGAVKSCKHWTVTVCVLEQKKRLRLITAVSDALSKRIKIG